METNRLIIVSVLLCLFLGASAKKKNQDYPRAEIKVSYNYHKKSMRSDGIVVERDVPFILLANKIQSKFYSDESKEVIGYQCFRAVTDYRGRKWTAYGGKNEKYIYLDFAWILRAIDWIGGWIDIGLCAVVLVARPFLLRVRLHGARRWPVAVVDS